MGGDSLGGGARTWAQGTLEFPARNHLRETEGRQSGEADPLRKDLAEFVRRCRRTDDDTVKACAALFLRVLEAGMWSSL